MKVEALLDWIMVNQEYYINHVNMIGKGQFGEVFEGYSIKKQMKVAIKVLTDEAEREIQTLSSLSTLNHPNIMHYYGSENCPRETYIFLEYCPNGTLTDAISNKIPELDVLRMFRQLVEGMCYMNAKERMHRDLKPDNILLGPQKDIKISDFGLAKQTKTIFVTGSLGTPKYAAPEVFLEKGNQKYTNKCDVWSAGLILDQMLTQKLILENLKSYQDLKREWIKFEIGQCRINYIDKHPYWRYFSTIMLSFDTGNRPSFSFVLAQLKRVYEEMERDISRGLRSKHQRAQEIECFLEYEVQKYDILITICLEFTKLDIKIRNEFKFLIMFLCSAIYLAHNKKVIRELQTRRLKLDEKEDYVEATSAQIEFIFETYRIVIEAKYTFISNQIKENFIPKILDYYGTQERSQKIMKRCEEIRDLAQNIREGMLDLQANYFDALKNLLHRTIEQYHPNIPDCFSDEQLRQYCLILIGSLLNEQFLPENYHYQKLVKDRLHLIKKWPRQQLLSEFIKLKKQLD